MACQKTLLSATWLVLGLAAVLCLAAGSALAQTGKTNVAPFKLAETCCKGCSYSSGCCCESWLLSRSSLLFILSSALPGAARDKIPVTVKSYKATRTITRTRTRTTQPAIAGRALTSDIDSIRDEEFLSEPFSGHSLERRNLCPACPKGAVIGKTGATACCRWVSCSRPELRQTVAWLKTLPRKLTKCLISRKTVTKTINKTLTKTRTVTKNVRPKVTLKGQVYYDLDNDGTYSRGDKPISRKRIFLVDLGSRARAPASLGSTITDRLGFFKMRIAQPRRSINGGIKLSLLSNEVIATVLINATSNDKDIPVVLPAKVDSGRGQCWLPRIADRMILLLDHFHF